MQILTSRSVSQAYLPIVASSVRASTLHYCCNDRDFAWGPVGARDHYNEGDLSGTLGNGHAHGEGERRELDPQVLLIDAGCEWECYASDSTFPLLFAADPLSVISFQLHDYQIHFSFIRQSHEQRLSVMGADSRKRAGLSMTLFSRCKRCCFHHSLLTPQPLTHLSYT